MRKKILAITLAAVLSCGLAACKKNDTGSSSSASASTQSSSAQESSIAPSSSTEPSPAPAPSSSTAPSSSVAPEPSSSVTPSSSKAPAPDPGHIDGGWQINDDQTTAWAPEKAKEALNKAKKEMMGAEYQPVAFLGSQVVAGSNYAFLCKETMVTAQPVTKLSVVIVYEDLQGKAKITTVKDFNLGAQLNSPAQSGQAAGGWSLPDNYNGLNLPIPVSTAYDKAMGDQSAYTPMAYLGSQVVSGSNYAVLCYNTSTGKTTPCIAYIYAPINGTPELTNIYNINVGDYNN